MYSTPVPITGVIVVAMLLSLSVLVESSVRCPPARPYGSILCPINCPERDPDTLYPGDVYDGPNKSVSVCNYCYQCSNRGQVCCPDACGTYCRDPIVEGRDMFNDPTLQENSEGNPLSLGAFEILEETSKNANVSLRQDAVDVATLAMTYYSAYDDIAKYIKMQFDAKYGKHWACFVAPRPNGAFYTFESPGSVKLRWKGSLDIYIIKPYRFPNPQ